MKLIEDLGTRHMGTNVRTVRFGLYECPDCGTHFECRTASVISGRSTRCKDCGKKVSAKAMNKIQKTKAASSFVTKAIKVHGAKYTYDKVIYTGATNWVTITCKVHGDFLQKPSDHLSGCGCTKCHTINTERFILEARRIHGDTYDYALVDYKGATTSVSILCNTHGAFKQTPNNHKAGNGCPKCSWERSSIATRMHSIYPTTLYYVYLEEYNLWKIGCTRKAISDRFGKEKVQIIETIHFSFGGDAYRLEQLMLAKLNGIRYDGAKVIRGGNTELLVEPIDFAQVLGEAYVKKLQEY